MNKADAFPAPPSPEDPQGGMTGATGNLSPDDPEGAFVPAERREVDAPEGAGQVTAAAHRRHLQRAGGVDLPGRLLERGAATPPNDRDGGYGSEHGLAADDPAYRMEEHRPAAPPPAEDARPSGDVQLGGDELHSADEEHF